MSCAAPHAPRAQSGDAKSLFGDYNDRIYQIRIIERASGKQAGLGSGFLVGSERQLISNFHVVASYTNHPERYSMEYVRYDGTQGPLELIALDVVNDLALLRVDTAIETPLHLAAALPKQGEPIYSIGNPHDLGWTVVPGTYNGITAHSIYERIHFSGSVNPGMSGGPVLNSYGQVIGVNVATAGNQLSFLIPLNRLREFIAEGATETLNDADVDVEIGRQLHANQHAIMQRVNSASWGEVEFGDVNVPKEIAPFIRCWGFTDNDPEILFRHSATTCNSEEQIYLDEDFNTGNIVYQFSWLETDELNPFQFYNLLKEKTAGAYPDNQAGKENVTEFECHEDFVHSRARDDTRVITKTSFCAREYRRFRGLYDVLFFATTVHDNRRALISHFTLAGVGHAPAETFTRRFMQSIQW